jgi:hypothetical protein
VNRGTVVVVSPPENYGVGNKQLRSCCCQEGLVTRQDLDPAPAGFRMCDIIIKNYLKVCIGLSRLQLRCVFVCFCGTGA